MKIYVTGDVHGVFETLMYEIKRKKLKDCHLIVAGDFGIGFSKPEYYKLMFKRMNRYLKANNIILYAVRGNHDDPDYFSTVVNDKLKSIGSYTNIKLVPDYTVLELEGKNILCIGGGISIDRKQRIARDIVDNRYVSTTGYQKQSYWYNEAPVYDEYLLLEALKDRKIDCVVSHAAPTIAPPALYNDYLKCWFTDDSNLKNDIYHERDTLMKVYNHMKNNDKQPSTWIYGHYHNNYWFVDEDTVFRGIDCIQHSFEITPIDLIIEENEITD